LDNRVGFTLEWKMTLKKFNRIEERLLKKSSAIETEQYVDRKESNLKNHLARILEDIGKIDINITTSLDQLGFEKIRLKKTERKLAEVYKLKEERCFEIARIKDELTQHKANEDLVNSDIKIAQDELNRMETELLSQRSLVGVTLKNISQANNQILQIKEEIETKTHHKRLLNERLNSLRSQQGKLIAEYSKAKEVLSQLEVSNKGDESVLSNLEQKYHRVKNEILVLKEQILNNQNLAAKEKKKKVELEKVLSGLKKKNEELSLSLTKSKEETSYIAKIIEGANLKTKDIESRNLDLEKDLAELRTLMQSKHKNFLDLNSLIEEKLTRNKQLSEKRERAKSKFKHLEAQIKSAELKAVDLSRSIYNITTDTQKLEIELSKKSENSEQLSKTENKLIKDIYVLKTTLSINLQRLNELTATEKESQRKIENLMLEIEKTEKDLALQSASIEKVSTDIEEKNSLQAVLQNRLNSKKKDLEYAGLLQGKLSLKLNEIQKENNKIAKEQSNLSLSDKKMDGQINMMEEKVGTNNLEFLIKQIDTIVSKYLINQEKILFKQSDNKLTTHFRAKEEIGSKLKEEIIGLKSVTGIHLSTSKGISTLIVLHEINPKVIKIKQLEAE
jgi:chromosome segregation ATPase